MDEKDREFLRFHRREICLVDFDAVTVAKILHEKSILTANDVDVISSEEKDLKQKERLLDVLPRRGPKSFSTFVKSSKELKLVKLYKILGGDVSKLETDIKEQKDQTKSSKELGMTIDFSFYRYNLTV